MLRIAVGFPFHPPLPPPCHHGFGLTQRPEVLLTHVVLTLTTPLRCPGRLPAPQGVKFVTSLPCASSDGLDSPNYRSCCGKRITATDTCLSETVG